MLVALASLAWGAVRAHAQEMDVPVALQAALFAKVVAFDRNAPGPSARVRIAIVYQSGNRSSHDAAREMLRALRGATAGERTIDVVKVDLDRQSLAAALAAYAPYAVYVAPLRSVDIVDVVTPLRAAQVRSFTGVIAYVLAGLAVGVRARSDRPHLVVNIAAARAEGAEYQAAFLNLAEVVP